MSNIINEVLTLLDNVNSVEFHDVSLKNPKVVSPIDILIAQITDRLEDIDLESIQDNEELAVLMETALVDLDIDQQCFNIAGSFSKHLAKARDTYRTEVSPVVFDLTTAIEDQLQENLTRRGYAELSKYEGYEHTFAVHEWPDSCKPSDILLENAKATTKNYVKKYSIGAVNFIMDDGYTKPQNYKSVAVSDETISEMVMDIVDRDNIVELFVAGPVAGKSMTEQIVDAIDVLCKREAFVKFTNKVKNSCGSSVSFTTFTETVNTVHLLKTILSELNLDKLGSEDAINNNFSKLKDLLDINVAFCFVSKRLSLENVLVLDEDTLNEDCFDEKAEYTPQDIFKFNVINGIPKSGRTEQAVASGYKAAVAKFESKNRLDNLQANGVYLEAVADAVLKNFTPLFEEADMDLYTRKEATRIIKNVIHSKKVDSLALDVLVNNLYLECFASDNMLKFCKQIAAEYEQLPENRLNDEGKAAVEAAAYNTLISNIIVR